MYIGLVLWASTGVKKFSTELDLGFFPYDIQSLQVILGLQSWTGNDAIMELGGFNFENKTTSNSWDVSYFQNIEPNL